MNDIRTRDLPFPRSNDLAESILSRVQAKVRENIPRSKQVAIVQEFEHEYTLKLIPWLIDENNRGGQVESILDVGAGWGTTMEIGHQMGMDVLGIDIIPIEFPDYEVLECDLLDINQLRFLDFGHSDLIVCTEVLEHLSFNPLDAFEEIVRKTDASWIFLSAPHASHAEYWPMGRIHYRDLPKWTPGAKSEIHPYIHRKPWEIEEFVDFIGELGFEVAHYDITDQRCVVLGRRIRDGLKPSSGYARVSGCADVIGEYTIPDDWWSRKFEYPWAAQFCDPDATVLDVGCGVIHPFKLHLANTCKETYGMDTDWGILNVKHPGLKTIRHDATIKWNMFEGDLFDRIFIISTLEYVYPTSKSKNILNEAMRVLRPDGLLVVTFDVPDVSVEWFDDIVKKCGFSYYGSVDKEIPPDVLVQRTPIKHPRPGPPGPQVCRRVFAAVLQPDKGI